jgi:hypothetical protein
MMQVVKMRPARYRVFRMTSVPELRSEALSPYDKIAVLTAVAMKNTVFWATGPYSSEKSQCFERIGLLHVQGTRVSQTRKQLTF